MGGITKRGVFRISDLEVGPQSAIATVGPEAATAGQVALQPGVALIRRDRITLVNFEVPVAALDDFGSRLMLTTGDSPAQLFGTVVDLRVEGTGGVTDPEQVDVAVGTTQATTPDITNPGAANIVSKKSVNGSGEVKAAAMIPGTGNLFAAPLADLFLNVAVAITTDGTVVLSGTIDVLYLTIEA